MKEWIHAQLSELLGSVIPEELTIYILEMQNEKDVEEYLKSLLDVEDPKHRQFIAELKKRRVAYNNQLGYKKTNYNDNIERKQNEKKKNKKSKENANTIKLDKGEKKKSTFVNLYSEDIQLKGRHRCNCEARKHSLINNCTNCGRIVCAQEGAGPCFFCNELVCTPEQQKKFSSNTKQATELYIKLMEQKPNESLEESVKQRDKLLEFDRNCSRRTKVIDDESDYFQANSTKWLTAADREKLQKHTEDIHQKKHSSKLNRKITLDFMGREIFVGYEEKNINENELEELYEEMLHTEPEHSNVCPTIDFDGPLYIKQNLQETSQRQMYDISEKSKIQDKEYLELSDQGLCLSMHQPYASLLVAGIKTHEGRTWYSSHRGRLWIASTAKIPTKDEISHVEHFYRVLKGENIKFPDHYVPSTLLGCVTVIDVLPQEEYKKQYPEGESDSPYVFICENNFTLPIRFPIQGKHKIYKLDTKIHQAAMKYLDKIMKERK